jgi:hypothetical protein
MNFSAHVHSLSIGAAWSKTKRAPRASLCVRQVSKLHFSVRVFDFLKENCEWDSTAARFDAVARVAKEGLGGRKQEGAET